MFFKKLLAQKLCLSIATFLFSASLFAQPTPPAGKRWQKQNNLSDEFNGGFDTGKWQKPLWNYGVPVQMRAQNSGVSNGNLWIRATLDNSSNRWFQTSRVMSNAQIKFPMYTECRMRTAHISAYNTFWLNNGDINNRDEIDIVENNSKPSCGCQPNFPWQMNSQYFITVNGNEERRKGNFDNRNLPAGNPKKGVRWNQEYHVVGMWWKDANNVQFYLDGAPAGKVRSTRRFTRNQNLIWDLWTIAQPWAGGIAVKSDLNNGNINTMYVDYVRTYKLVNAPGGGGGGTGGAPIGKYIWLRKTGGDRLYVRAIRNGNKVSADAGKVSWWEKFKVESHPKGGIALLAQADGKYLQVPNKDTNAFIRNSGTFKGDWERFQWKSKGAGKVAIKSLHSNKWLQAAHNENNGVIRARGNSDLSWETFDFAVVAAGGKSLSIDSNDSTNNLKVINSSQSTDNEIVVTGTGEGQTISIYDLSGASTGIQLNTENDDNTTIDVSNLSSGIYFAQDSNGNTVKFLKR